MKKLLLSVLFGLTITAAMQAQNFAWVKPTSATGRNIITRDNDQNIIVSGSFANTYDFDPSPGISQLTASPATSGNQFVQKLDADGNLIWAKNYPGTYFNLLRSITTDNAGAIYHTGELNGTADFNPGTGTTNVQGHCYLAKLNADGSFGWAFRLGHNQTFGYQVLFADESIYICGSFYGTVDFDPGAQAYPLTSGNDGANSSGFVSRYSLQGEFMSAFKLGNNTGLLNMKAKSNGNLVVYGYNNASDLPNGNAGSVSVYGGGDYFFGEYKNDGETVWAKSVGSNQYDVLGSLCLDSQDNIFIQGRSSSANFDADPGPNQDMVTGSFVAKYDPLGNYLWAKAFTGIYREYGMATDSSGNVFAAGLATSADVDLDPGPGTFMITANNDRSYIVKLDADGAFAWGYQGPDWDAISTVNLIENIYVSPNDELVISNHFENQFDFDPGTNQALLDGGSSGGGYILKFIPDAMGIPETPVTSTFSWQSQNGVVTLTAEVETDGEIFNALGQKMAAFGLSGPNDFRFSSQELPTGIYFIRGSENGRLFRLKILVK